MIRPADRVKRCKNSRVESGRVKKWSKCHGVFHGVGLMGSALGSGEVALFRPDPREVIRPARSDPTRQSKRALEKIVRRPRVYYT